MNGWTTSILIRALRNSCVDKMTRTAALAAARFQKRFASRVWLAPYDYALRSRSVRLGLLIAGDPKSLGENGSMRSEQANVLIESICMTGDGIILRDAPGECRGAMSPDFFKGRSRTEPTAEDSIQRSSDHTLPRHSPLRTRTCPKKQISLHKPASQQHP